MRRVSPRRQQLSPATLRYHPPRRLGARDVDCIGLPQIPDEACEFFASHCESMPPPHIRAACDQAITAAMAEHQRRRGAVLSDQE